MATALLAVAVGLASHAQDWGEVFIPMDYSTCGYHASETGIPDVKNEVYVAAGDSACQERLQRAIDYVSSLKPNAKGQRGAVLLGEGTFDIDRPLRIRASGVVLRGSDKEGTRIVKHGPDRGAVIYVEGGLDMVPGDTIQVAGVKVSAGSCVIPMDGTGGLSAGQRILITRPSTEKWIKSLKCNIFGGGLDFTGWKPGDIDITWDRTITAVNDSSIVVDSPITTSLAPEYGGAYIVTGFNGAEITECGVENLTLVSDYDAENPMDEDHCWNGVWMEDARDCWVRRVNFLHFAGSAVTIQKRCSRINVEDCVADEPVSEIGGWRRDVFLTRGQQTLIQRCVSRQGIHDFAAGFCAAGPNAFVQCSAEGSLGFSGSVGSWACGLLFDIVDIEGGDILLKNLGQFRMGTGWNTGNSMLWQCTGSSLDCYSPDDDNWNSASGCWGMLSGDGEWSASNNHITPRSIFYYLLRKRIGGRTVNGRILPVSTAAASSPTVEAAREMAQASLNEPKLTMEAWINSLPYTASVSHRGVKDIDDITWPGEAPATPEAPSDSLGEAPGRAFAITDGRITFNGRLIVGDRYHIPWWNGRVKESFLSTAAQPAITRFVPGREGVGLTDRIDSVVVFLEDNGYCLLDHNYGLWYDLRRTDHERVKRATGEVWAPFYEQPFSRTGEGKGWDGLSLYDLTKPNKWYWARLSEFAAKGAERGQLLFHQNYFQHNILEAGAHWVDCPWRPVNNVNGTSFPEPVPFYGDKRVFMAEQFYSEDDDSLRRLHRQYIRQCLDNFRDDGNVVQLIGEEYTGPAHFMRFWLRTIKEWEEETGLRPMVALSCTKDVQDEILSDSVLSKVVDIIDIRYWHYSDEGTYAPGGGLNLAPRQLQRRMPVGNVGFRETFKAVLEYRRLYPDKAVTFFGEGYTHHGWAILMGGGSCPNVPVRDGKFLQDVARMEFVSGEADADCHVLGKPGVGYLVYSHSKGGKETVDVEPGTYRVSSVNMRSGEIKVERKGVNVKGGYSVGGGKSDRLYWLEAVE